jgi:hypothetical protein
MRVQRGEVSEAERSAFEQVVRAGGRDPAEFSLEVFTVEDAPALRTIHVAAGHGVAQYDAALGRTWTLSFAQHLARGCFH